mmetsp:Transcript_21260/g.37642  ORF Transcript_21260/g.37642 Transcript_21260/m.37642 type:complete len:166 (-) Transcript_21260:311-808(-)
MEAFSYEKIKETLTETFNEVEDALGQAFESVKETAQGIVSPEESPRVASGEDSMVNGVSTATGQKNEANNTAESLANQVGDTAQDVSNQASETANSVADQISDTAQDVQDQASDAACDVKDQASETADNVVDQAGETAQVVESEAAKHYRKFVLYKWIHGFSPFN